MGIDIWDIRNWDLKLNIRIGEWDLRLGLVILMGIGSEIVIQIENYI